MNQKRLNLGTLLGSLGLAFACLTATPVARAENAYPARYVTLLVPYAPGGTTDIVARQFANGCHNASASPGWSLTNRPGAATISPHRPSTVRSPMAIRCCWPPTS